MCVRDFGSQDRVPTDFQPTKIMVDGENLKENEGSGLGFGRLTRQDCGPVANRR